MPEIPLHLPRGQNFRCTGCGRCCRASWRIAADPRDEEAIRSSLVFRKLQDEGLDPLIQVEGRLALGRRSCGDCLFLEPDGRCALHTELGPKRKPIVCQTYPYVLTETPDGIFAALSFACPAVLENVGPPVEESRVDLSAMLSERLPDVPRPTRVGSMVTLLSGCEVSWADYKRLEDRILSAFCEQHPVRSLLAMAVNLIRGQITASHPMLDVDLAQPYDLGGFDRELVCMVSCNLIPVLEGITEPSERIRLGSELWNGSTFPGSACGVTLPPFRLIEPSDRNAVQLIARYLRGAIVGKRLLAGSVVSRLLALTCGVSLILHYAQALAGPEMREIPMTAWDQGFTLVESGLLTHTQSFDGFFVELEHALTHVCYQLQAES